MSELSACRKAFEAQLPIAYKGNKFSSGRYYDRHIQDQWEYYLEIWNAALDQAAKACEEHEASAYQSGSAFAVGCRACAAAITALKEPT